MVGSDDLDITVNSDGVDQETDKTGKSKLNLQININYITITMNIYVYFNIKF